MPTETELRLAAKVIAVREVLISHLPVEIADERARNIVMAATDAEPFDAAERGLDHWTLTRFTIPAELPRHVAEAIGLVDEIADRIKTLRGEKGPGVES